MKIKPAKHTKATSGYALYEITFACEMLDRACGLIIIVLDSILYNTNYLETHIEMLPSTSLHENLLC